MGSTRCEGCQRLFCFSCINKHHDELEQEFQQVMDTRNRVREDLDLAESASNNGRKNACMVKIDRWETETIERIRGLASRARMNVQELLRKSREEIGHRFKQVSDDIERRQKNGNYLETDIDTVKNQLEQLKTGIRNIYANIHVNVTMENEINWDTLILVTENVGQNRFKSESRELSKAESKQRVIDRNSSPSMNDNARSKFRSNKDAGPGKFRLSSVFSMKVLFYLS